MATPENALTREQAVAHSRAQLSRALKRLSTMIEVYVRFMDAPPIDWSEHESVKWALYDAVDASESCNRELETEYSSEDEATDDLTSQVIGLLLDVLNTLVYALQKRSPVGPPPGWA